MSYYTAEPGRYPEEGSGNSEPYGRGWYVRQMGDRYMLSWISGALQGELKEAEITEADFNAAKEGKISLDELCVKYGVF